MSREIKDEMVHGQYCYWDEASRSYIPYTMEQLTLVVQIRDSKIEQLEHTIKSREATIEGLHLDIRRLKKW